MYLNAQLATTGQVSGSTVQPGNTLYIGRAETEDVVGGYVFHGVIDDIRIYNRALTENEIFPWRIKLKPINIFKNPVGRRLLIDTHSAV